MTERHEPSHSFNRFAVRFGQYLSTALFFAFSINTALDVSGARTSIQDVVHTMPDNPENFIVRDIEGLVSSAIGLIACSSMRHGPKPDPKHRAELPQQTDPTE